MNSDELKLKLTQWSHGFAKTRQLLSTYISRYQMYLKPTIVTYQPRSWPGHRPWHIPWPEPWQKPGSWWYILTINLAQDLIFCYMYLTMCNRYALYNIKISTLFSIIFCNALQSMMNHHWWYRMTNNFCAVLDGAQYVSCNVKYA